MRSMLEFVNVILLFTIPQVPNIHEVSPANMTGTRFKGMIASYSSRISKNIYLQQYCL